ncbi:MAG: carboxymuconolactone decarboxylase family protein [Ferruginibacter sp.]
MKKINVPGVDQISEESKLLFGQIKKSVGKVPNLYATIGYSAIALKAFLTFQETLAHGVFTAKEREAIALVVSEVNGCNYCLAAHTATAMKTGFTMEDTISIRQGLVEGEKLKVLVQLAKSIAEDKGRPDEILLDRFFEAGYNEAALMELVGLVSVRIFTNYVYALTEIPIDFPAVEILT